MLLVKKMLSSFGTLACDKKLRQGCVISMLHETLHCSECGICLECFVSHFEGCTRLPAVLSQVFPGSTVLVLNKVLGAEGAT